MRPVGLRVVELRGSALFQDAGRRHVSSGVPVSGAFDRVAHDTATVLLGGTCEQATLEVVGRVTLGEGPTLACAVTGRARVWVDDREAPTWTVLAVPAGARVQVEAHGRAYLAVAGGFAIEAVLGSRSTCLLGPLGPPVVRLGDVLPLTGTAPTVTAGDFARPGASGRIAASAVPVRVVAGPHLPMSTTVVTVVDTSRIGVRVRPAGGSLVPGSPPSGVDLPSLGVIPGTIQVLAQGDWMVLGPDAGTMGGYPVAGVVLSADLHLWAHVLPRDVLRLDPVDPDVTPAVPRPQIVRVAHLG